MGSLGYCRDDMECEPQSNVPAEKGRKWSVRTHISAACRGLLVLSSGFFLLGASSFDSRTYYLGFGLLNQNIGRVSGSATGSKTFFGSSMLALTGSAFFPVFEGMTFSPMVSYTPLGRNSPEGHANAKVIALSARLAKRLGYFDLIFGPGLMFYQVGGDGEVATLNNGTSTSQFATPDTTETSQLYFIDLGFGFEISKFRWDLDTWVTDVATSRRGFNLLMSLSFGLY